MWWMLLIALEGGMYKAEIVLKTEIECAALKSKPEDVCVPVEVSFPTQETLTN